ncbi:shikimate dehydrogenase [Aquabacterium sp.]|uniref:shikimate dehydrogenase family protein n=1 Tax=Aquabacterium sp. TaxID=1872578 RepID=UPI0019A9BC83|nr:shikimate dehydrogenase [Aquabacterium sp.]MBC7699699.1 shikimate dehydrogenase [Aquabacterium sp.]
MPLVSGTTDVYLILGDPVEQVRAPQVFNLVFARMGIDAVLVPAHVAPEHLEAFVRTAFLSKNIKGMWVAIPHKAPITQLLDSCTELGRIAGAVNGIRRNADGRLKGGLFDGEGFVASLDWFGIGYAGKRALVIGAGGGASAIAVSLACAGARSCAEVALYDPVPGKAAEVAARIAASSQAVVRAAGSNDPAGYDVVINASPLGLLLDDAMPCDVSRMDAHAALVDILMKNQPTPLVRAARARGLVAQPGFEMLIQQTHLYLDFFGFIQAAEQVRQDATFLREMIYPAELAGEIIRTTGSHSTKINHPEETTPCKKSFANAPP